MAGRSGGVQVRHIRRAADPLLVDLYAVLGTCFDTTELMDLASFKAGVRSREMDIAVAVVNGKVVGGVVGEWYEASRVYLGSYVGVLENARGHGAASALIEWLQERWGPKHRDAALVLAEVEDPRFFTAKDHGDARLRLKLYRRLNARMLDVRYTLPALEAHLERVPNLRLITFPVDPRWRDTRTSIDARLLSRWFKVYVEGCGGEPDRATPAHLATLIPELASRKRIPLFDIPEYDRM